VIVARDTMGELVTGRENKLIALDPAAVGSRDRHTALSGRDFRHFRRHEKARPIGVCGPQQCERAFPWIDHQIAVAHDRPGPGDPKLLAKRPAVEESAWQTGSATRLMLPLELFAAKNIAGEVERVAARNIGNTQLVQPRGKGFHSKAAAAPCAGRLFLADLAGKFVQGSVNLVLNQCSACHGGTERKPPLVDHRDRHSGGRERIGHEGTGDAGADYEHIRRDVPQKASMCDGRSVAPLPYWASASQIPSLSGHSLLQIHAFPTTPESPSASLKTKRIRIASGGPKADTHPAQGTRSHESRCESTKHRSKATLMGLFSKDIQTMDDLLLHGLKDIYYAENRIVKSLPGMIDKSTNRDLTKGLRDHLEETNNQIARLDQVFQKLGQKPQGVKCPAIDGLISEADDLVGEVADKGVLDAAIIGAAQSIEHYEIARYGTLIAWAESVGHDDIVRLLNTNLNEEKAADRKLSAVALRKGVNRKAAS
jgi:ferritin-like metal-binding protein YciE